MLVCILAAFIVTPRAHLRSEPEASLKEIVDRFPDPAKGEHPSKSFAMNSSPGEQPRPQQDRQDVKHFHTEGDVRDPKSGTNNS